jgi:hypothetical protein
MHSILLGTWVRLEGCYVTNDADIYHSRPKTPQSSLCHSTLIFQCRATSGVQLAGEYNTVLHRANSTDCEICIKSELHLADATP